MSNSVIDYIVDGFKTYFPMMAKDTVEMSQSGPQSIIAVLNDGSKFEYHDGMKTIRKIKENNDDASEASWRNEFNYRLHKKMSDAGINIEGLAERSGISRATIYKYINQSATPSCWTMRKLAQALKCDVSELI